MIRCRSKSAWSLTLSSMSLLTLLSLPARAQVVAPTGGHHAGRPSDTGFSGLVNATGGFSESVALDLPADRSGLPIPVQVVYGGTSVGAAGLGWDIPISYVRRETRLSHRLPSVFPDGTIIVDGNGADGSSSPVGREQVTLNLLGQHFVMMRKGDQQASTVWVPIHDGPQLELHAEGSGSSPDQWRLFDGNGFSYVFTQPGALAGTDFWTLRMISDPRHHNGLQVEYAIGTETVLGSSMVSIDLTKVSYNQAPSGSCAKNQIVLDYGTQTSTTPLSMSMAGQVVLARFHTVQTIDVMSRASCAASPVILRRYALDTATQKDPDTGLPLLAQVTVSGRQDIPADFAKQILVGKYSYGSASTVNADQSKSLNYQLTQSLPNNGLGATRTGGDGNRETNTLQSLIDLTGDGRPDLIFQPGDAGLAIGPNLAAGAGGTATSFDTSSSSVQSVFAGASQSLQRETLSGTASLRDFNVILGPPPCAGDGCDPLLIVPGISPEDHGLTSEVWRQAIDVNGDGRLDIVDASEVAGQWVLYLNKAGPSGRPADIIWVRQPVDVRPLIAIIRDRGFGLNGNFLSLSRRHTGTDTHRPACAEWDGGKWVEFTDDDHPIGDGPNCHTRLPESLMRVTYVEWELRDMNGDSYPDFVYNSNPLYDGPVQVNPTLGHDPSRGEKVEASAGAEFNHAVTLDLTRANQNDPDSPPIPSFNDVNVLYNIVGPHLSSNPGLLPSDPKNVFTYAFAQNPIPVRVHGKVTLPTSLTHYNPVRSCGVEMWAQSLPFSPAGLEPGLLIEADRDVATQYCGYLDANGDGLADRLEGTTVFLQNGNSYTAATLQLPDYAQGHTTGEREQCPSPEDPVVAAYDVRQTGGLRDLNGDGIPDFIGHGFVHPTQTTTGGYQQFVQFGTGTGFGPSIPINVAGQGVDGFVLSDDTAPCPSVFGPPPAATTLAGLYDIDGDGKPDLVRQNGSGGMDVYQLTNGSAWGRPEAGRLTRIDNGYGALTKVTYRSAKADLGKPHAVPFPEIVASQIDTVPSASPDSGALLLASTYHAFGSPEMVFDSYADSFIFAGYRRRVDLQPLTAPEGVATITDTNGLEPFHSGDLNDRFLRTSIIGRPTDVTMLSGVVGADPWALLGTDMTTDVRRTGATHFEYSSTEFVEPFPAGATICTETGLPYEMVDPFDDTSSQNAGTGFIPCLTHGFAFTITSFTWRGSAAPQGSTQNVTSHTTVTDIDDFGRVLSTKTVADGDGTVFVDTAYVTPPLVNERVLTSVTSRTVSANLDDAQTSELFSYDDNGLLKSDAIQRFEGRRSVGETRIDSVNDPATGLRTSMTLTRDDGASQTLALSYDPNDDFKLQPSVVTLNAAGAPGSPAIQPLSSTYQFDPITMDVVSTTEPNLTQNGASYDGFGRLLVRTVTPPGGTAGALAAMSYTGFGIDETGGRHITTKVFTDAVANDPTTIANSPGRSATVALDALGREQQTQVQLGANYGGQILTMRQRSYDLLGRVQFEADPYPTGQDPSSAYGTSRFYNTDGTPRCFIRGNGPQPFPHAFPATTNEASEIYPTCYARSFANNREVLNVATADSLLAQSAQSGVNERVELSFGGKRLTYLRYQGLTALDSATYDYDGLGRLTTMTRFLAPDFVDPTFPAITSWTLNSAGEVTEFDEVDTAPRTRTYDNWGELTGEEWTDETSATLHLLVTRYDALGRASHREEQVNGTIDPETVNDYQYDQPVNITGPVTVSPTFVLGRLSHASSAAGAVTVGYDNRGRINTEVFTDDQPVAPGQQRKYYVEKQSYHGDGSLLRLEMLLSDDNYADERVDYTYDSAGRPKQVTYVNGGTSQSLFASPTADSPATDAFGRVRQASYGVATYTATYADVGRRLLQDVAVKSSRTVRVGGTNQTVLTSREISFPTSAGAPFDPMGRERIRTELSSVDSTVATPIAHSTQTTYDALGRVSASARFSVKNGTQTNLGTGTFGYDALGNLFGKHLGANVGTVLTYAGADRDRLTHIDYPNGAGGDVEYDGSGNITLDPGSDALAQPFPIVGTSTADAVNPGTIGSRSLTYFGNGLVHTIDNGSSQATFRYDAFGQVQELDLNGAFGGRLDRHYGPFITSRHEVVANGSTVPVLTRTIPLPGTSATRHGSTGPWIFAFGEARGNRFFVEQDGTFVQDATYLPYGEADTDGPHLTGPLPGAQLYTNEQWNGGDSLAAFGLVQLGARLYDPAMGRFLSRDPMLVPRSSATTNPYAFANNDPVNSSDPSGMRPCDNDFGGCFTDDNSPQLGPLQIPDSVSSLPPALRGPTPSEFKELFADPNNPGFDNPKSIFYINQRSSELSTCYANEEAGGDCLLGKFLPDPSLQAAQVWFDCHLGDCGENSWLYADLAVLGLALGGASPIPGVRTFRAPRYRGPAAIRYGGRNIIVDGKRAYYRSVYGNSGKVAGSWYRLFGVHEPNTPFGHMENARGWVIKQRMTLEGLGKAELAENLKGLKFDLEEIAKTPEQVNNWVESEGALITRDAEGEWWRINQLDGADGRGDFGDDPTPTGGGPND